MSVMEYAIQNLHKKLPEHQSGREVEHFSQWRLVLPSPRDGPRHRSLTGGALSCFLGNGSSNANRRRLNPTHRCPADAGFGIAGIDDDSIRLTVVPLTRVSVSP